jgi:hypothetical protein
MLTIRQDQAEVFRQNALRKFEDRMITHIGKFFPKEFAALGEAKTRETIQYGIKRAKSYGIVAERDVCKYIDLMVVFGRDFDRDKRLPWARSVLEDPTLRGPSDRTDRLYKAAMENSSNRE